MRKALAELYAYFARNEAMLANVTRDAPLVPALAEVLGAGGAAEHERAMREALLSGRALSGGKGRRARAAVGLALSFSTWQRLTREEGLDGSDAVKLMVRAIEAP